MKLPFKLGGAKTTGKKSRKKNTHLYFAIPIVLMAVFMDMGGLLRGMEYGYLDFLFKFRLNFWGIQKMEKNLAVAAIDDNSIKEIGSVPWPRSVYARLIEELVRNGARLVVFDVLFTEPDRRHPEEDRALIEATRKWKDRVVHAFFEQITINDAGLISVSPMLPFDALHAAGAQIGFVDDQRIEGQKSVGARDLDGYMRRTHLHKYTAGGDSALSLGTRAFAILKGITGEQFLAHYPDEITINFPGMEQKMTVGGKEINREPYVVFPIADVLAKRLKPEERQKIKDAVIIVASLATGYYDHFPTPYYPMTPGVGIHIYALNNLINNNYLKVLPPLWSWLLTIMIGLVLAVFLARFNAKMNLAVLAGLFAGMFTISIYLFVYKDIVLHILVPILTGSLVMGSVTLYRVAVEEKEKRWIKNTFGQYLSPKVVSLLVESPEALKLGGDKRLMTVFFLDIAGFTTISESLSPEELTKFLNHYLTMFTDIVLKYDGVVDKYIGDCVMAFWNAPFDQSQHPSQACLAALEIRDSMNKPPPVGIAPCKVRIGINTGFMVVGNMGSQARFNYTVVGDAVNFASRLEGANKFFKTSILASESVYEIAKEVVVAREIGRIRVVGKDTPVGVFELIGRKNGEVEQEDSLATWNDAMEALKAGDAAKGKAGMESYLQKKPRDPTAERYMKLLDLGVKKDFVINLTEK